MALRSPATGACNASKYESAFLGAGARVAICSWSEITCSAKHQIGLQQSLGCPLHGDTRQPAHLAELLGQFRELLMVGGSHVIQPTFSAPEKVGRSDA